MTASQAPLGRDWAATFTSWAAAPSETESTKCENAGRAVRKAIASSAKLSGCTKVFTQGSYRNRTNVKQDSDVDICVQYTGGTFYPDYSMGDGLTRENLGHVDGTYHYATFKQDVEDALVAFFGRGHVTRGNKAFDVHENTYRIDADVVPSFEHRRFLGTPQTPYFISGTELHPDNGDTIINWPQQNYDNGTTKNDATSRGFKGVVRILKRLRNEMTERKIDAATPIESYLIECLVWNVPNEGLMHDNWTADVRYAIADLWNNTRTDETCKEWGEINELKYLFRPGQPWTRQAVNDFLQAAWDYVGFE
jgi:predicted nucleotidyltransferase